MARISTKQGGLLLAVALVIALIAAGIGLVAHVRHANAAAARESDTDAHAPSTFDLTSKNAAERPHIDPVPEAVQALHRSGFTPVQPGSLTVVGTAQAGGAPLGVLASDDNRTKIGVEADFAQLIADGLGLKPRQAVSSWAD